MELTKEIPGLNRSPGARGTRAIWWFGFALSLLLCSGHRTCAQSEAQDQAGRTAQPRFELEEIVVTATRIDASIQRIPRNVTVITGEDIAHASSNNIVDLLARESSINPRGFFGHDKQAGVDIRGMGDTFVSNVIVMVDGMRLNPPDLNGPDLSSVPLDQVERIEIVRGAGSVAYGNGAVGGVINIITKKDERKPEARVHTSYGSYETLDSRASYSGRINSLGFKINADYLDSDGYRDNGYLRKKDTVGQVGYDFGDNVTVTMLASYHEDQYGLPGRVSKEDLDSRERRTSTDRPEDSGETADQQYLGRIEFDLAQWGRFKVHRGYRFRDNSYVMGYSPLITREGQTDSIDEDTKSFDLSYDVDYTMGGLKHRFQLGVDHYQTEYVREERSKDQRENSETKSLGFFMASDCSLTKTLFLRLGYRYSHFDGDRRTDKHQLFGSTKRWVNGTPSHKEWTNHAEEAGLVYSLRPDTTLYASYATSFRVPNVDELAQAQGELKPQEGSHVDIGGRFQNKGSFEIAVTLFEIRIDDEIFFDGDLQVNRNYNDHTLRRGIETDVRVYANEFIYLWGNYAYTKAKFENRDTWVPLVPEHKASGGMEWQVCESLVLSVTGTYVGPRFDGNDQNNNRFDKLDGYSVWDGKVIYQWKDLEIFAGVNNIFNKLYSTVAYSETHYPMPERNFYGGVEWRF